MAPVHTWCGVLLGSLLFAIFWMGTLSVFDREIDRWMMPATRLPAGVEDTPVSLDALRPTIRTLTGGADQWFVVWPSERVPTVQIHWREDGRLVRRHADPRSGEVLPDQETLAGTGFIFPFHYGLHIKWLDLGYWLVGAAGMAMLVLLVSGVIVHRKLFTEFFTFRPRRRLPRATLDLHNVSGVLALPFHFVITLSGLIIFMGIYFPLAGVAVYDGNAKEIRRAFNEEGYGLHRRDKVGLSAEASASLDDMTRRARELWGGSAPRMLRVWNDGDVSSVVEIRREFSREIAYSLDQIHFDASTGEMLRTFSAAPVMHVQRLVSGLHFVQFDHWAIRWMYFAAGLLGCVLIASGFVLWIEVRRERHFRKGLSGTSVVEALTVGSVTGLIVATLAFLIANRLFPLGTRWGPWDRSVLEVIAFFLIWCATFIHAFARKRMAWLEQCRAIAVLCLVAPLLNWSTTGHHPIRAADEALWGVLGVDCVLLATAGIALLCARRLGDVTRSRHAIRAAAPG
jgi:uncharacterized iron-regulated membrane protein